MEGATMSQIQFDAIVKDGKIEIPAALAGQISGEVHVVISLRALVQGSGSMIQDLLTQPLPIKGFRPLSREEAHLRGR
jgi:hypothetical protein